MIELVAFGAAVLAIVLVSQRLILAYDLVTRTKLSQVFLSQCSKDFSAKAAEGWKSELSNGEAVDAFLTVGREPSLPDGFFTSTSIFELEKRAIFQQDWQLVTHKSRFTKAGDYHTFSLADIPFYLILSKDQVLRGFHNVCRHRAYTITQKRSGSSLVMGCRYHGWSYDTRGRLVKAPHFDGLLGFDKDTNGLFEIQVRTDRSGFVWVNLDARSLSISSEEDPLQNLNLPQDLECADEWELEGKFNWKVVQSARLFSEVSATYSTVWTRLFGQAIAVRDILASPLATLETHGRGIRLLVTLTPTSPDSTSIQYTIYQRRGVRFRPEDVLITLRKKTAEEVQRMENVYKDVVETVPR